MRKLSCMLAMKKLFIVKKVEKQPRLFVNLINVAVNG